MTEIDWKAIGVIIAMALLLVALIAIALVVCRAALGS